MLLFAWKKIMKPKFIAEIQVTRILRLKIMDAIEVDFVGF